MPAWYGAGATTAKEPGIQSAYENTLAMFMAYSNGADVTFGTGLLDGSRILCLENMVVDDEIIGMVKRILTGIEVSEETLAVDLIKKMGFNGNYLFDGHTRRHVRELWQAKLGETGTYEAWKNAGGRSVDGEGAGQGARDPGRRAGAVPRRPRPRSSTASSRRPRSRAGTGRPTRAAAGAREPPPPPARSASPAPPRRARLAPRGRSAVARAVDRDRAPGGSAA